MIKVVFDNSYASVYDTDGACVNSGNRPEDRAFARNVIRAEGYKNEETYSGHKRVVNLWREEKT